MEEAYETYDAIINEDYNELKEELGDLLLEIVLISQVAKEDGYFKLEDAIDIVNKKLIRRHPHVFGDIKTKDVKQILTNWEKIKKQEKTKRESFLDGIPDSFPPMLKAYKMQEKASRVGFDWSNIQGPIDKYKEEFDELMFELNKINSDNLKESEITDKKLEVRIMDEIGDMFFVLINLSRRLSIDPNEVLTKTTKKFRKRFIYVEQALKQQNKLVQDASPKEMDDLWNECKKLNEENDE